MLLTTPMLRVLRDAHPDAEIHLLANDYNTWIVDNNPCVDRRWVYGRAKTGRKIHFGAAFAQLKLYVDLKRERFDAAIVAGGFESHRGIARARHANPQRLISYAVDHKLARHVTDALIPDERQHESMRMAKLLEPLNITLPAIMPLPVFEPPASALQFADDWLTANHIAPREYCMLGIGSRNREMQPSTTQVLSWAKWMYEQYGLVSVFIWTPGKPDNPIYPGDDLIAAPVRDAKLPYIFPFSGELKEAIGLIWRARTSLIPDSGLMHIAAASPGGVLGLFANSTHLSNPVQWAPIGKRARFLDAPNLVAALDDDTVFEHLKALLA